ncbi:hypothetical protein GCM10009733_026360 [Nonomuraea maheshkhaliensis]|uniref:PIN like domain-containing protein n=1 Tax=Nonomuraea maheshkhaliensis TaxID=419590 RepID=A0ABP4QYF1_9ACTN
MSQDTAEPIPSKPSGNSLRELFPGYFPPDKDAIGNVMTSGLVVFDTNPLLDAYKLTGTARIEFLASMRALDDRLWIPHQVGLEFLRNRSSVIDYSSGFPARFRKAAGDLHKEVQQLKDHRGLKDEDVKRIKQDIDAAITAILDAHTELYAFGVNKSVAIDKDPVFKEIEQIIARKVGPPLPNIDMAMKIGKQRLKEKIPPGYSDAPEKGEEGALGDYFVWAQTLIEAKQRGLPVLLVTNETKADWIRTEGSFKRGPRPELVDEMLREAGQPFQLMNVRSFLFHAGQHLSATVSESTIKQAESVQRHERQADFSGLEDALTEAVKGALEDDQLYEGNSSLDRSVIRNWLIESLFATQTKRDSYKHALRIIDVLKTGGEVELLTRDGHRWHLHFDGTKVLAQRPPEKAEPE